MNSERQFFVDIHCHPNMRAFHNKFYGQVANVWENISTDINYPEGNFAKFISNTVKSIYKNSQANLNNLFKGNVKVAYTSLYPIERGFLKYRTIPRILVGNKNFNAIYEYISGLSLSRINYLQQSHNLYFNELMEEYHFIKNRQGKAPDSDRSYRIVKNYNELVSLLENEPKTIAIIITIEGGHCFGTGTPETEKMPLNDLKKMLTNNIGKVKQWEHPPFFLNLAHHFWNQLCGHSKSLKFPINGLLNQNKGLGIGITELGNHAIHELLSTENGRRILIDIKHMSVKSRKDYYKILNDFRKKEGVNIPIICSHCGVNGFNTMDESIATRDTMRKSKDSQLHRWSINLSDEEIRIIHDSGGIIGIMLDKGLLGGIKYLKRISDIEDKEERRLAFNKLIFTNIFQVIKAVGKKTAWDIITIGSDFDGGITHIDHYHNASTFVNLYHDLVSYLDKTHDHQELWYGYRPREIVNKIMRENAMIFMEKYFN